MRRLISAADVERAASDGRGTLDVAPGVLVSPLAVERARDLGVALLTSSTTHGGIASGTGPTTGEGSESNGDIRNALRSVLVRSRGRVMDRTRLVADAVEEALRLRWAGPSGPPDLTAVGPVLSGRVGVVTGAGSGIGRAVAIALGAAGARVVIGTHRGDAHDPEGTAAEVEYLGGEAVVIDGDVRSEEEIAALVGAAVDRWGRLDIVVPNAAIMRRDAVTQMTDEAWHEVLDVDLAGVVRTCRAAAREMDGPGAIVAVGSIAGGITGWAEHAHYAAAKAGIVGAIRSLGVELGPRGIRVNAVMPGLVQTPQSLDPVGSVGADGLARGARSVPLRRIGLAEEVATAVRFLASDEASYITGQALVVDGGLSTVMPLGEG